MLQRLTKEAFRSRHVSLFTQQEILCSTLFINSSIQTRSTGL